MFLEDNPFYKMESAVALNQTTPYRETYNFFSSNSCNFVTATHRAKNDCPIGHVFCNITSKPMLAKHEMTYVEAVDYCKSHNTTICES